MEFAVSGSGFYIQAAGKLMIEGEILPMKHGIDLRSTQGSRSQKREIGATLDQQRLELDLVHARQIEIFPDQVETKLLAGRRISGAAGDFRVLVSENDVGKFGLVGTDVQIGIEFFDGLAVNGGAGRVDVSLRLRMRAG